MNRKIIVGSILAAASLAATAQAHFDVRPYLSGGSIVTGGIDDGTTESATELRAFGFDFGEDPGDPFTIGDPGFNALAGTLTSSTSLNFQIMSNLKYWDGSGVVATFADVTTGEAIRLTPQTGIGSLMITGDLVTLNGGPVNAPFAIGTTAAGGSIHRHNGSQLWGSDGNAIPALDGLWGSGDGVEAPDGVYAYEMQLSLNGNNTSLPFWIVYNNGVSEEAHDLAIDTLAESYAAVPEPASLMMLAPASLALMARRRQMPRR